MSKTRIRWQGNYHETNIKNDSHLRKLLECFLQGVEEATDPKALRRALWPKGKPEYSTVSRCVRDQNSASRKRLTGLSGLSPLPKRVISCNAVLGQYECLIPVVTHEQDLHIDAAVSVDAGRRTLMLDHEIVDAVADGQFHVYAVDTVEEAIEVLTGVPAGERTEDGSYPDESVFGRVDRRLRRMADVMQQYGPALPESDQDRNDSR